MKRDIAVPKEAFTEVEADEVTADLTARGMTRIIRIPVRLWKRIPACWDLLGCSRTDSGITYLYFLGGWWFKQDPVHLEKMRNQAARLKRIAKDSRNNESFAVNVINGRGAAAIVRELVHKYLRMR